MDARETAKSAGETVGGAVGRFACLIGGAVALGLFAAITAFTTRAVYVWLCNLWGM